MNRAPVRNCCWFVAALLAACGNRVEPPPVAARSFDDPGFVAAGEHELHYGAILAAELPDAVAAEYGIDPRMDTVIVNLSVLRHRSGQLPASVDATVSGTWRDLIGEPVELRFRAVTAGGAVSYVATAPVRNRQPIVLELRAQPVGSESRLTARITRQFDLQ